MTVILPETTEKSKRGGASSPARTGFPRRNLMKQICALALLFVFVSASTAVAADPLKVHEAGFGPEIQGLRLGKPMTWPELLDAQGGIIRKSLAPFLPAIFGVVIADNYTATTSHSPVNMPGKWIVLNFLGGGKASIMNSGGDIMSKVPESGTLDDLFVILKKNGLNYISAPNITLRDERVIEYSFDKDDLPAGAATAEDFAQWLNTTYSLGTMERKGKEYEVRNPPEGWRAVVTDSKVTVFSMTIPDDPKQ